MTFLPIVERELRVASRRRSTHLTRFIVPIISIVIGVCIYLSRASQSSEIVGPHIFYGLGILGLCYSILAGRWFTVDCLTEEKREGTLGLLFLTDLKGHDIVFGKLAATSINGFFSLLALFPVMAVTMLMGGTTYGEFWRLSIVLISTFVLSLSIGIAASATHPDLPGAAANNMGLLFLTVAVPICAFAFSFASSYSIVFWFFVFCIMALIQAKIREAARGAAKSWRENPEFKTPSTLPATTKIRTREETRKLADYRKKLLDINAYFWLVVRDPAKPRQIWLFLAFSFGWWFVGWSFNKDYWFLPAIKVLTCVLVNVTLKLWLVLEASHQLSEDRRSGAVELLLSSPLGARDILRGQQLARRSLFLWPMVLVGVLEVLLLFPRAHDTADVDHFQLGFFIIAGIILLAVDYFILGTVATHQALIAGSPAIASSMTVVKILILPLALVGAIATFLSVRSSVLHVSEPGFGFYLVLWFALRLMCGALFGSIAWRRLQNDFQSLAATRFSRRTR